MTMPGETIITSLRRSAFLGLVFLSRSKTVDAQRHDVCASDVQCLNEGRCQLVDHSLNDVGGDDKGDGSNVHRHCVCKTEFGGSRCEKFCPLNCLNGGYCRFNTDSDMTNYHERFDANPQDYACQCLGYWAGTFCEIPYENCSDGRQCFHGGTCEDRGKVGKSKQKTVCTCPEGFKGRSCEVDLSVKEVGKSSGKSSGKSAGKSSSSSLGYVLAGGVTSSSSSRRGPVLAGVFVPMILIAFVYAAFVYRRRRKQYSAIVVRPPAVAELVPWGSGSSIGHQQASWKNII
jgi:hypothetical protein